MKEDVAGELAKKLNVLISLSIRQLLADRDFEPAGRGKRGIGSVARYLSDMGLGTKDIADILGAPLPSVRTLLTPNRRK
jgi:hypothetical protein